jgi:gamma-glutamyltranspeptidase
MSVAGGDMQDQTSLQLILDNIEFGMKPRDALLSPRFYTYHSENSFRPSPDPNIRLYRIGALDIYDSDSALVEELVRRNHIVKEVPGPIGDPAMVYIDHATGTCYAATEPFYERDSPRGKYCGALTINKPQ